MVFFSTNCIEITKKVSHIIEWPLKAHWFQFWSKKLKYFFHLVSIRVVVISKESADILRGESIIFWEGGRGDYH
jgi:hypothetical protein